MWKAFRRKKLGAHALPPEWLRLVESHCPAWQHLSADDRRELTGHIQIFLAEKRFEGCDGLAITDQIKVCIAANACLLLLHRQTDYFPGLRTILVYPDPYYAPVVHPIGHGVIAEGHQMRAGEAWPHGSLVLAWSQIQRDLAGGGRTSVILHEFAHQLDYEDGYADGAPLLYPDETHRTRHERHAAWLRVMTREFEALKARLQRGESTLINPYAATNPAEFFAVTTETFFGRPQELRQQHPELYAELKWFYHQDPAAMQSISNNLN
jgi:Mlc titration factor MtfA (ptsG expression regulator)